MTATAYKNPTSERRIYVASLSDYNAGILHGIWINCDFTDEDELNEQVQAMLKTSPAAKKYGDIAEEYAIHDHEGFEGLVGEYSSLSEVAEVCELLDNAENPEALLAYIDNLGGNISDASLFEDAYNGEWDSELEFTYYYLEMTGDISSVPEWAQSYFDYDSYSRDLFTNDYFSIDTGRCTVYVFRNV